VGLLCECTACGHKQIVGIIENGRSGFLDPNAVCRKCGAECTLGEPRARVELNHVPPRAADIARGHELAERYGW
jgi:hypothetical protein